MTDKHIENSVRLLDIIYDLYAGEGGLPVYQFAIHGG